jgi:hypothetical protein
VDEGAYVLNEVVKKLVQDLNRQIPEDDLGDPFLSTSSYRTYPLDPAKFSLIRNVKSTRRFAFLDGGNLELIGAPNFSIQLNRVYYGLFSGKRRIQPKILPQRIEFFSLTMARFRDDNIFYDTSIFPIRDDHEEFLPDSHDLSLDSTDRRITIGESRADIGRVASVARRFAEWKFARQIVDKELADKDVLVMDGILRTTFINESKYARSAYQASRAKGVIYTGLSKSSRLFTTTGLSLLGAIRRLATNNRVGPLWYYYPVAESLSPDHEAAIFIARLNEGSQRVFRYEIDAERTKSLSREELNDIFCQLSVNCADLGFPGYPYGLVDADDNARIRHEELETYRVMFFSEISKLGASSKCLSHIQSSDAHQVLNALREVPFA